MGVVSHTCLSGEDPSEYSGELFVEVDSEEIEMEAAGKLTLLHLQRYRGRRANCREKQGTSY